MPRLVGKQSHDGLFVSLLMLVAIAAATGLEYTGVINIVPGFGKNDNSLNSNKHGISSEQIAVYEPMQKQLLGR